MEDLYFPLMRRTSESLVISNNDEKAKILMERFFPQLAPADLSDIMGETLVICLRVDSDMTTEEMARTISRFLNNIVLRLDGISNKALKTCRLLIIPWLTDIAKAYFIIGYFLRLKKAITINILYKKR